MSAGSSGSPAQTAAEPAVKAPLPTPANASAKSAAATSTKETTEAATTTEEFDPIKAAAASESDIAAYELEQASSVLMQKVRDVDGVQAFTKRRNSLQK